jgi:2-aminoadipate transaminase
MKFATRALSSMGQRSEAPPISWLMELSLSRPNLISLAAGFTDNPSLPVAETRELLDALLRTRDAGRTALQYGATAGDPKLRRLTAARVRKLDDAALQTRRNPGIYDPASWLITHGSQQLLYLVTEALCDEGDIVLVEDPTYFVYLGIAQSRGLQCAGIPIKSDGVDLATLEARLTALKRSGDLRRVKMLYLVSYLQNPSSVTTSFAVKQGALDLLRKFEGAAGHPIYLLEDAAYRELRFAGQDVPSGLAARGGMDRVIYSGTYSKPFATGARVGFARLPEPLLTVVTRLKGNHDFGTANLLQQLVCLALATGKYDTHLEALHRRYAKKAATMEAALLASLPSQCQWRPPEGGLYFWAALPNSIATGPESRLFEAALKHEVLYVPGELCYADDPARRRPNHEMRLSFGGADEQAIHDGIARLGEVIRGRMGRQRHG